MSLDITFKSVCTTIKKQGTDDSKLIEAVDSLLGLALICSPVVLGPTAAALLPTLAVKNELIKIGKSIFEKLTKQKDEDYLLRYETMCAAYGLLVFTSFFDALDARLPDTLRNEIGLLASEKVFLAKDGLKNSSVHKPNVEACDINESPVSTAIVAFPHPTETLAAQCQKQAKLWKQMSQGFLSFVQKLAFWEQADSKKQASLLVGLDKLEEAAAKRFEAQYFELARKFEDFAIWANLQALKGAKALIGELSDYVKQQAQLSAATDKNIDVGFTRLRQAVLGIPETLRVEQATEIADSFNKHYQARINDPIIEDKDIGDENAPRLSFPKVCDAFVPQAFRVLRQSGKSRQLEDEATWSVLPRRNDLGPFLLSYLSSPYSMEAPLLILGHPGSGKSLLTTILAAQLMSKQFIVIRVPLREVDADADIQAQIEEFIKRISGVSFDSWIKLRSLFKNCPPVVILDGYDELLQASGQVFASYIMEAQRFQQHQAEQGWPVRVIITSRVTLIDKAAVPSGSSIVRLLEFDQHQRKCWSAIWNKCNAAYFRDAKVERFVLPSEKEKGAEKILNLAEQPLLLLMLALYDSQGNQLRTSRGLDRTKLYDSLLRRFVIRERRKEKGFNHVEAKEREKALATEMQRLGVAALGMYNRRKVHILSAELDDDLLFFKLEREVMVKSGKALSQADLLLGSFFFVHKSKAQHSVGADDAHEELAAFEFLHNTFGEFLAADFIVRRAVSQVQALRAAEANELLRSVVDKLMGTADGFERDWFASLVYTPLFTRPIILEMIREWAPQVLKEYSLAEDGFVETLDKIVLNQIKRLLSKREMPQIMRKETAQEGYRVPFGDHPLVGHIAIYSINLVLLRLVTGGSAFIFNESEIASHEDGTRPWDRLMHMWRSWFSLGNLNGLASVMVADRSESKVVVTAKSRFQAEEAKGRLDEFYNVAVALGEDVSAGLAGIYLFDPQRGSIEELSKLEKRLKSEGFDLGMNGLVTRLLAVAERIEEMPGEFVEHARRTLEQAVASGRREQIGIICAIVMRALEQQYLLSSRVSDWYRVFRGMYDPRLVVEVATRDPRSARSILGLAERLRDTEWILEFSRRLPEAMHRMQLSDAMGVRLVEGKEWLLLLRGIRESGGEDYRDELTSRRSPFRELIGHLFHPRRLLDLSERSPEQALIYLQIIRELGGERYFEEVVGGRMYAEVIDRMFHPDHLLELSKGSPEGALACLQIFRELGSGRYFAEFVERSIDPKFMDRLFNPRHLVELSERNPEGALAYLQIIRELGGGGYFEELVERRMDAEFRDLMFYPRYLLELSERNPAGAKAYLQLLRELGGERYLEEWVRRRKDVEFTDRMSHPRYLLDFSERNPEGALAYLQVFREVDGGRYFKELVGRHMDPKFIERLCDLGRVRSIMTFNIHSVGVVLALARQLNSPSTTNGLGKAIRALMTQRRSFKSELSALPIASIPDWRWLAEQSGTTELNALLDEVMR